MTFIIAESLVNEVIDTAKEADFNLQEFGRRYLTALSFQPLQINRKKIHFAGIQDGGWSWLSFDFWLGP
jgi:hypothetical protein